MRKGITVLAVILLIVVLVSGCIGGEQHKGSTTSSPSHTTSEKLPQTTKTSPETTSTITTTTTTAKISNTTTASTSATQESSSSTSESRILWKPDGVISPGEYPENVTFGEFSLFLKVENDTLMVGMKAPTSGWVAIGFGGSRGMKDTDIVIAYVLPNSTVMIRDDYSTGFAGPHNADELYGGRDDIIKYGGSDNGEYTVVEFSRKLDTGDRYDYKVIPGERMRIIWAYGAVDDFLSDHVEAGSGTVVVEG
jgi:hypothetical protein